LKARLFNIRLAGVLGLVAVAIMVVATHPQGWPAAAKEPDNDAPADKYAAVVQPLLKQYCLGCHSTKAKKGSLDLERFTALDLVRKDLKPWQQMIEMLEANEMPPKNKPQPTAEERNQLIAWVHDFLNAEARARAGDPGRVPLRRLSNTEYDCTIRDLTGADLRPTREFPADGAAGEGFTNAAEALTDVSPALLTKYLNAAKDVADHAVLLPDGFRFSLTKTRRDWTDESLGRLREFFAAYTGDGRLPVQPYLAATVRHRDALLAGKITLAEVASKEKLNAKYLGILWQTLTDKTPSYPLDVIRARWRQAADKDVGPLVAEVAAWQTVLWKAEPVGSYRYGNTIRMAANDPAASDTLPLRVPIKPGPGQSEVTLYLAARDLIPNGVDAKGVHAVWQRPRFESAGKPALLLRDYAQFGPAFEVDYPSVFANSSKYLAAVVEAANNRELSVEDLARKHALDAPFLKRWIEVLAVEPYSKQANPDDVGRVVPVAALDLLEEKVPKDDQKPAINGWRKKGADLPVLITNSSDKREQVPGRVSAHKVAVHPMPREFVAVAWKSPTAGSVRVAAQITHAHPACGNGVAWWIDHRRLGGSAVVVAEGLIDLGGEAKPPAKTLKVGKGDLIILAVDAKNGDHTCDLTEIDLTLTEIEKPGRVWDLSADIANNVLDGNPHADKHGNKDAWSFVLGPTRPVGKASSPVIPSNSALGQWREAAADPKRQADATKLAEQVQTLLSGARPPAANAPDLKLYDTLVSGDSPLFQGIDPVRLGKPRPKGAGYGLEKDRFGKHPAGKPADEASVVVAVNSVTEVRLPAALFRNREFVVEGKLDAAGGDRVVQFQVLTAPPGPLAGLDARWDGKSPVMTSPTGAGYKQLLQGHADFRGCFPQFICFPRILPEDEVVCLKMYHREDDHLARLFLDDERKQRLDRLWLEHRFISRQPVAENAYLPQFIGFVTQDQPKELLNYFESQRPVFRKRAEDFEKDAEAAIPKHLDALLDFTTRAYRRPLQEKEKTDLLALYQTLRKKEVPHEEAFRAVLARVLVSPGFLFRIEQAPAGMAAGPISDWELATRLSYFLWSSAPDEELRSLCGPGVGKTGQLSDPKVLAAQTQRMLKDPRIRSLAIEFGTQWIHVRGFDELKEKNEKLFPTFNANLRKAIYEESILFFQDLFQGDQPVTRILDADYAFLNETLAKHYGIPGVSGPQWRRVEGVRKYGRGGILGLASVQAKEAGASRTSPVLRGNWVVETLLGEKLPRPPANVPKLPEEEGGADRLTMRQEVEKHTRVPECAVCHQRIDPFGFALEKYDSIGRLREKDLGGLVVDSRAKLKDGTEFDGIDGLRTYLLTKKKDLIVRLFCRRLLGYALGRAVTLSDQSLLDEMVAELNRKDGKLSAAVLAIVQSPQFRMIRGGDFAGND
jgi:mono/diheme cytochrome c family protein